MTKQEREMRLAKNCRRRRFLRISSQLSYLTAKDPLLVWLSAFSCTQRKVNAKIPFLEQRKTMAWSAPLRFEEEEGWLVDLVVFPGIEWYCMVK